VTERRSCVKKAFCFDIFLVAAGVYKDRLKVSLNKFSIDYITGTCEDAATDRPGWRSRIAEGAVSYEEQ